MLQRLERLVFGITVSMKNAITCWVLVNCFFDYVCVIGLIGIEAGKLDNRD